MLHIKKHHDLHHQDDLFSIDADEKVSLLESGSFCVGEHTDLAQLDALHLRMRVIMNESLKGIWHKVTSEKAGGNGSL